MAREARADTARQREPVNTTQLRVQGSAREQRVQLLRHLVQGRRQLQCPVAQRQACQPKCHPLRDQWQVQLRDQERHSKG